jgi:hypothetical protein
MKHLITLILICLPAQLAAGGRCTSAHRDATARALSAKASTQPAQLARAQKVRPLHIWQRPALLELQIL